ncbi:MAG: Periplasmic serine endoprotease DegP [Gammaproteobacteria bacterium]|nr:Periplasmic serine endoprotease DegP [Gammaproteobacteria bacterium]
MRILNKWLFAIIIASSSSISAASLPVSVFEGEVPSLASMLEETLPGVVNISTTSTVRMRANPLFRDPFFRRFFDPPPQQQQRKRQSLGSGVVIDADEGLVVTNAHVIEKADEISVKLQNGGVFEAEVVGADSESDIAVVRIDADNLTEIPLGDSDELRVGDFVVAIGNPFGLNQTVTSGIVSALGRSGLGIEGYEDFIQTDASINPGNSGGALIDLHGDLVGINTAILAPSGGNVGIGFSIPINMVRQLTGQIVEYGQVERGRLGVYIQDLTPDLAQAFGIDRNQGAVVSQVVPESPAEKAGLQEGDVVIALDGKAVDGGADLRNEVGLLRVGKSIELTVLRDGDEMKIKAIIEARRTQAMQGANLHAELEGATFAPLPEEFKRRGVEYGVYVKSVTRGSPAWDNELRGKDVITSVNRRRVRSLDEFRQSMHGSSGLLFSVRRGRRAFFLAIR